MHRVLTQHGIQEKTKTLAMIALYVFVVGVSIQWTQCALSVVTLEAESMDGHPIRKMDRSKASGLKTVRMHQWESITTEICLNSFTAITITDIMYSNDGGSGRISLSFDSDVVGLIETVPLQNNGLGWESFTSGQITFNTVTSGRHKMKLTIEEADKDGVEIDAVKLEVNNSQSPASVNCKAFCFENVNMLPSFPQTTAMGRARAVQMSVQTKCAEEDNVNIPLFHDSLKAYQVTASLPKYPSFENNRGPDWRNCKMASAFWRYSNIDLDRNADISTESSQLSLTTDTFLSTGKQRMALIVVDFALDGQKQGSIDSDIGTYVVINNIRCSSIVSLKFQYFNRYNVWSTAEEKGTRNMAQFLRFETPDYVFREGAGNKVRIEIFATENPSAKCSIVEIYMMKRQLLPDRTIRLYNDGFTIIEGVAIDMWWRINETMKVAVVNGSTSHDAKYIRIYHVVPWITNGFSQIFVMYQDGNVRLLPTTPHGLDWIPFGSSVIIGQSDPTSPRPCAPVMRMDIDPILLTVKLLYADGGSATLHLAAALTETYVHVFDLQYTKDVTKYPFFTLRSMYVTDGNCDVDHFSVDGDEKGVLDPWDTQEGTLFVFYRKCISSHNTQSPDISVKVIDVL